MKVELAQLAGRDNDTAYNLERTLAAIAACAADTQLIVFPETHLMGFPTAETVAHTAGLGDLKPLRPVFLSYILSFLYVGIYWNNHHHMLHTCRTVTGPILWANLHLLFWLSLVPFTTGWMGENDFAPLTVALYGGVLLLFGGGLALGGGPRHIGGSKVWLLEEGTRPGELMPIEEDEHGTYILNSRDLRAIEHVQRLVDIGVDSLKIEGRTKSPYYVARAAQGYRRAIDDAVAGRPFDTRLLGELEGLASRGYTDGFYQRHSTPDHQNYLRGHSESGRSLLVGEVVGFDAARGLAEVEVKNGFGVGDRLEFVQPGGNIELRLEHLLAADGGALERVPGSGRRVWLALPAGADPSQPCFIARFL